MPCVHLQLVCNNCSVFICNYCLLFFCNCCPVFICNYCLMFICNYYPAFSTSSAFPFYPLPAGHGPIWS